MRDREAAYQDRVALFAHDTDIAESRNLAADLRQKSSLDRRDADEDRLRRGADRRSAAEDLNNASKGQSDDPKQPKAAAAERRGP